MLFLGRKTGPAKLPFRACIMAEWIDGERASLVIAPERCEWISADRDLAARLNAVLSLCDGAPLSARALACQCLEHEEAPCGGRIVAEREEVIVPETRMSPWRQV